MKDTATPVCRHLRTAAPALFVLALIACSGDDGTAPANAGNAPTNDAAAMDDMAEEHGDRGSTAESTTDSGRDHDHHSHGTTTELAEGVPVPTIAIEVTEDPVEGWNLRVRSTDFRIVPENVSTAHVAGEGHMHLYIDGKKVSRLYGEWHHIGPLAPGEHEVRVELSSNDHSALAVGGDIIDATAVIVATETDDHAMDHGHDDHDDSSTDHDDSDHDDSSTDHDHGHGEVGEPTGYDANVADAVQTIMVDVVGGDPVGGVRRVEADLGSVVALLVTSDIAEEVHVHSYDILRAVADGSPAHFAFTVSIPGVFEVELEGSGRLLLQLEIS